MDAASGQDSYSGPLELADHGEALFELQLCIVSGSQRPLPFLHVRMRHVPKVVDGGQFELV